MPIDELASEIRKSATAYLAMNAQASRTMQRARVLHLLDQLRLERAKDLVTRRVSEEELRRDPGLLGMVLIHLDLMFRSSVAAPEILETARRGVVRVGFHPRAPKTPIGVVLAQPTAKLVRRRRELFDPDGPSLGESAVVMPYALAASPPRLGAGIGLMRAVVEDCAELASSGRPSRVVTFSPLTGMRARVIRMVDDNDAWARVAETAPTSDRVLLRQQLLDLLALAEIPDQVADPARSWLLAESRRFAESTDYAVGNFHRYMGAELVGLSDGADPHDSDSMWARAYFDYGV